jgi:hypothetical protein
MMDTKVILSLQYGRSANWCGIVEGRQGTNAGIRNSHVHRQSGKTIEESG